MHQRSAEFREYEYKILARDGAFYLYDDDSEVDLDQIWNGVPGDLSMVVKDGVVSIRSDQEKKVRLLVEVRENEPCESYDDLLLLGDCCLDVPSGRIVISGSLDNFPDAARIPVRPALYKMRLYAGSLDTVFGGLRRSQDHLRVVLWLF